MLHYLLLGLSLTSLAVQADIVCLEDPYDKQKCHTVDTNGEVFSTITIPYTVTKQHPLKTNNTHDIVKTTSYQTTPSIYQKIQAYASKNRLILTIVAVSLIIFITLIIRLRANNKLSS